MTNTLNDEEFYARAVKGGASREVTTGNVPDRGYMIGGARTHDDLPFPEIKHPVDQFQVDHVRHHARLIRDQFAGRSDVYQGAWVEDDHVVLDASERFGNQRKALSEAKKRGERAIYDVKGQRDIPTR